MGVCTFKVSKSGGLAGSTVIFYGKNLGGWKSQVTIGGKLIPDLPDLTGDSFQIKIPTGLFFGFYEIQVEISHLFRRTFFFQVGPTIQHLRPGSGTAGLSFTIHGKDLSGFYASVYIRKENSTRSRKIIQGCKLKEDKTFQVEIPNALNLAPGYYLPTLTLFISCRNRNSLLMILIKYWM